MGLSQTEQMNTVFSQQNAGPDGELLSLSDKSPKKSLLDPASLPYDNDDCVQHNLGY